MGGAQELARVGAAVLPAQPFAVEQLAARELDRRAAACEPLDRLAVERLVFPQQGTAPRFDPERPLRAARPGAFAQAIERVRGVIGLSDVDGGFDELDQRPAVRHHVFVLAGPLRIRERLAVATVGVVAQRGQPQDQPKP
jgi:hypothetical protein